MRKRHGDDGLGGESRETGLLLILLLLFLLLFFFAFIRLLQHHSAVGGSANLLFTWLRVAARLFEKCAGLV